MKLFTLIVLLTIFAASVIWSEPGDVITIWASGKVNGDTLHQCVTHVNLFVTNGRRPAFVTSGDVCFPGQPIKWYMLGQLMSGIWLKGHLIGLPDGSIISDSCLPQIQQSIPAANPPTASTTPPAPPAQSK
jgi:hypothetical protein